MSQSKVRGLGLEDIPIVIVTCGLCSLVPMEALSRKRKEPENIGAFKPLTSVEWNLAAPIRLRKANSCECMTKFASYMP